MIILFCRKRVEIIEEMNFIQTKETISEKDTSSYEKLQKELTVLTAEYIAMLEKENIINKRDTEKQNDNTSSTPPVKPKPVLTLWSRLSGTHSLMRLSANTSNKIGIRNKHKLKISQQKHSRNYYDIDF